MKKILTFTLAILATMSMWASETFTFALSADGTKGLCYAQNGPTGGSCLTNNAFYYVSLNGPKKEGEMLNPYKTGIVFAPTVNVTMAVTLKAGSSSRTFNLKIEEIQNDYVWNAFINCAGQDKTMSEKIFELADDTEKQWWVDNAGGKVIKKSSGNYVAGTDDASKKYMSGESASETMAKSVGTSDNIAIAGNATVENTDIQVSGATYTFSKDKKYRLYLIPSSSTGLGLASITFTASCDAPANPLELKANKTADVVAGDEIEFSTTGGNDNDVTIAGKNGETITANKWTAVKGEHIFTATQDVKDGKCGNTVELKIVVVGTDPVTAAKITGPTTTKINKEVTLTCEAADATFFQWYKNGAKIDGATAETYKFTPTEAGEIIFACEAWNKNNDEAHPAVKSADFKVTVSEGDCGLLIKADLTGDKTAAVDPNSTIGGTTETNLGQAGKLDKKCFFGVTLADGEFAEGDIFIMNITTAADVDGSLKLYEDKAGSNLIVEIKEGIDGTGEKQWKLPAAATGKKSIYVVRGNVTDWNAYFTSIAVKRPCGNESNDASLKYLTVNGDTVKTENTVYNYEIPLSFKDPKVTVKYELNDAGAKSGEKLEFDIFAPENAGDTLSKAFTVTAEDGTAVEYTVNVIRVVTDASDATIKWLKVNNEAVEEKEGVFAYEVPVDKKLAKVTVEFELNNPDAKADKASGFEMDVPAAGAPAKEETINVVAKDGTKKTYKISVTKAEGGEEGGDDEGLEGVQSTEFRAQKIVIDGQLFILKNGVLYNATGTIVK